jgi:hypothetical protein
MNHGSPLLLAASFVFLAVPAVAASGFVSGIYQQVCSTTYDSCGPLGGVPPAQGSIWEIATPHYALTTEYAPVPGVVETFTADTQLIASLSPGNLHAYATSGASITNPQTGFSPGAITRGYSSLSVSVFDNLHFQSAALPAGADVSFELTGILHSTITADQTGNCATGPAASASMVIQAGSFQFAPGTFVHTSCGQGSDLMTATQVFHATVGGPAFGIVTSFALAADAGLQVGFTSSYSQAVRQTVDASNTASIVINVLTPGVGFASDSGYLYGPVPEPTPWRLMAGGLAALAAWRRRGQWRRPLIRGGRK